MLLATLLFKKKRKGILFVLDDSFIFSIEVISTKEKDQFLIVFLIIINQTKKLLYF